jgi:hypothetical protein
MGDIIVIDVLFSFHNTHRIIVLQPNNDSNQKNTSESWIGMICLIFNLRQNHEQKEGVIPVFNNIALNQRMIA